jgi:hypothetical protein
MTQCCRPLTSYQLDYADAINITVASYLPGILYQLGARYYSVQRCRAELSMCIAGVFTENH